MITTIDEKQGQVIVQGPDGEKRFAMSTPEGFAAAARAWLRASWDAKYIYGFTWFGRPIIQMPDDLVRVQELIYRLKPDVIIETGVAHGGSLVFYASLMEAMGHGRVIGIDIHIRPHNRAAIGAHPLAHRISLIEGDSTSFDVIETVSAAVGQAAVVLVILDSNHSKEHVLAELRLYSRLVTIGSYIIAADGVMELVAGGPRTKPDWEWNNPRQAAVEFVEENSAFVIEEPAFLFNEGAATSQVTYWPGGYLKRLR
jgi:cephalosporin hydroxylase